MLNTEMSMQDALSAKTNLHGQALFAESRVRAKRKGAASTDVDAAP